MMKMNSRWIDARFNNEEIEGPLRIIDVRFSLPKEALRDVTEVEELTTAKAEKYFKICPN
jgi:hypothetical protein